MEERYLKSAIKQLMKAEVTKELIYKLLKQNGEMTIKQLSVECDRAGNTIGKLIKLMVESGHVKGEMRKDGYRTHNLNVYSLTGLEYKKKTYKQVEAEYLDRPVGYGFDKDKFFNPFEPKIPQGGKPMVRQLFNEKDNDYFKMPLKKSGPVSIGSTFSLMDGAY